MNLIARLFGIRPNHSQETTVPAAELASAKEETVPAELFIDNNPPALDPLPTSRNIISDFLEQEFNRMGARDAFNFHSNEMLEARKKEIRSQFLFTLDKAIQEKRSKRLQLENRFIEMAFISTEIKEQITNSIAEIDHSIEMLTQQKELSAMDEGWVMGPIRQYHTGFLQGSRDYMDTESLLTSSNIF